MAKNTMMMRTYTELIKIPTFEERFKYLQIHGSVGVDTFGFERYLNQTFYRSREWKDIRRYVILRDNCCDLGDPGREILDRPIVHHMNPIMLQDLKDMTEFVMNPEYLITTSHITHNAIHYGDSDLLMKDPIERRQNDTCPWKH